MSSGSSDMDAAVSVTCSFLACSSSSISRSSNSSSAVSGSSSTSFSISSLGCDISEGSCSTLSFWLASGCWSVLVSSTTCSSIIGFAVVKLPSIS